MVSDFRWLHFSDLHFNQTENKADIRDLRQKLLRSLRTLHGQFSNLRYVFITGDIADKGEYDSDTNHWISQLMDEFENLGVSKENIFWCCGNHDIPRKNLKHPQIIRMFVNCVREEKPPYEEAMNNSDDRKLILDSRFGVYYKKHHEYLGRTVNPEWQELDEIHFFYALEDLNLIVLNTCVTSLDDEDERNLCIMEGRLYDVFQNIDDRKPTFVIGHHGVEFLSLKDQDKVGQLFDDYHVDYYLCGHSHKLSCRELPSTSIREFTAGGMLTDGHAQAVFYLGLYSTARHGVHLTPYVYGVTKKFKDDYDYNGAFTENKWYKIDRMQEYPEIAETDSATFQEAIKSSEESYNYLRKGDGRLAGIHVDDNIIPDANRQYFHTFVSSTETEEKVKLLDIVAEKLKQTNGIVLTGEGGSGKTIALLRIWEKELANKNYVPVYIPLNEYNAVGKFDGFIENYLNRQYSIDIRNAAYNILMLLDGFNEITDRQSETAKEINTLLMQHGANLKIIITSRTEQELNLLLKRMDHYVLAPLDEETVREYLNEAGVSILTEILPVLVTPMMLTLYTSTCFIQDEVRKRLSLEFMKVDSKAAIIYNYLLCQLGKVMLDYQETDMLSTYSHIFFTAPYIAYRMEKSGEFFVDRKDLRPLECERETVFHEDYILESADNILGDIVYHEQKKIDIGKILVYRQHMLIEEERKFRFRHQYFRDFLAALNIVNYLKKDASQCIELLKDRRLPETILEMLCGMNTITGREEWERTLSVLSGLNIHEAGYAVNNVLMILSGFQKKRGFIRTEGFSEKWYLPVMADRFERLDFESVELYGLNFSGNKNAYFSESRFTMSNFVSQGHHSSITCIQYYPDGERSRVALTASLDGTVKEWDLERGGCISTYHTGGAVTYAVYEKKGNYIFAANTDGLVYRFKRNEVVDAVQYSGCIKAVKCIDICSDGKFFITTSDDCVIREWKIDSNQGESRLFEGSESIVRVARYSVCNRYIISGSKSGEVRVWDREHGYSIFRFKAHKKPVTDISVCPDGSHFLTASSDSFVKEWRMIFKEDGTFEEIREEPISTFKGHTEAVMSVCYNCTGNKVLTSSNDSRIILWARESAKFMRKYEIHSNRVNRAVFSPEEDRILSVDYNGQIIETDMETGEIRLKIEGVDDRNRCLIKMDDEVVLVGTNDGTVKAWNVSDHRCQQIFPGHEQSVTCIVRYRNRIYTAGEDRRLYAWSYAEGFIEKIVYLDAVPRSMDLSADGERLAVGLDNYSIVEFNAIDLSLRKIYQGMNGSIEGLKYIKGHEYFISISKDRFARRWHSGEDESMIIYKCSGNTHMYAVNYDCQKNSIYIADQNNIIELNGETFEEIHRFEGHTAIVCAIYIDSAKRKMLTGSNDGKVREWNLDSYSRPKEIEVHNHRISGVVYCGERIVTSSFGGTVGVWNNAENGGFLWKSMPYGRINIAGCKFDKCTYANDEVKAIIIENGGIIEG